MTVVYSASSVQTYLDCSLRWWFTYIAAMPQQKSEALETGIAVHEYAEGVLLAKSGQGITGETSFTHQDENVTKLCDVFLNEVAPTYGDDVMVETPFRVDVRGVPYSGVIDSIDGTLLRDLKTTGSKPSPGRYRRNMIGYYIGATIGLDKDISGLQLDYIVRTKKPYYLPERQEVPTVDEMLNFSDTVEMVAELVEVGDFRPTGLEGSACRWCPYTQVCEPYARMKENK